MLFSASQDRGNIARLIGWLVERDAAFSSDLAVEEARRNLAVKRPSWLPAFEKRLRQVQLVPSTSETSAT